MKKQYVKPSIALHRVSIEHSLLNGSPNGNRVYQTEVSDVKGFARSGHSDWDDED